MKGAERTPTIDMLCGEEKNSRYSPMEQRFYSTELMAEFKEELALRNLVLKNVFAQVFLNPDISVTEEADIRKGSFVFQAKYRHMPGKTTGAGNMEILEFSVIEINGTRKHLPSEPEKVFLISKREGGNFGVGLVAHRNNNGEIIINTPTARERVQETLNKLRGFSFVRGVIGKLS